MNKQLFLFPTAAERAACETSIMAVLAGGSVSELCGFGAVAAGIATTRAIERHRPDRVWLLGIAGSYLETCEVGQAYLFNHAAIDGIGVGQASQFQPADQLGWKQFPGDEKHAAIGDRIHLTTNDSNIAPDHLLLSVCSASADFSEAECRTQRWPTAVAEDMEGFAVAMACQLANVPLTIIRGISNRAGDRDHANWKIEDALAAATKLAVQKLTAEQ